MWMIRNGGPFYEDDRPKLPSLSLLMVLLIMIMSVSFTTLVLVAWVFVLATWG
jgi:hypothetical protein